MLSKRVLESIGKKVYFVNYPAGEIIVLCETVNQISCEKALADIVLDGIV
jgi:hypothetical protein